MRMMLWGDFTYFTYLQSGNKEPKEFGICGKRTLSCRNSLYCVPLVFQELLEHLGYFLNS